MFRLPLFVVVAFLSLGTLLHAGTSPEVVNQVVVSVKQQRLMLLQNGARVAVYPVSTSKFGIGDNRGRMTTPVGAMAVAQKIGDHAPLGAVFHNRRFTGEILRPNAPGRDPIVSRIIWLRGLERSTADAFSRCIYIHGTAEEKNIGRPASYGCIRMKSKDVVALYTQLPIGTLVRVVPDALPSVPKARVVYQIQAPDAPVEKGRSDTLVKSQTPAPPKHASADETRLAKNS
ncbi:MAG: L,D-transpeptidase family protein [Chthoniobacterales bacterium]